jgi:hypothetical protein
MEAVPCDALVDILLTSSQVPWILGSHSSASILVVPSLMVQVSQVPWILRSYGSASILVIASLMVQVWDPGRKMHFFACSSLGCNGNPQRLHTCLRFSDSPPLSDPSVRVRGLLDDDCIRAASVSKGCKRSHPLLTEAALTLSSSKSRRTFHFLPFLPTKIPSSVMGRRQ